MSCQYQVDDVFSESQLALLPIGKLVLTMGPVWPSPWFLAKH